MYNLLVSLGISLAVVAAVLVAGFPVVSAIVPALLVFPIVFFVLWRRTQSQVQQALAPLQGLMQAGKVSEVQALMRTVRDTWGRWQFYLTAQIDGQLGMLEYAQMHFDQARPLLEKGAGARDWSAATALACILWREGDMEAADQAFRHAAKASSKEVIIYVVWASCMARKGERAKALAALSQGLEAVPDNGLLRELKNTVANKKRIDTRRLPEMYMNFFPEEVAKQAMMRGRRGPNPYAEQMPQRVQQGPPMKRPRGKLARKR